MGAHQKERAMENREKTFLMKAEKLYDLQMTRKGLEGCELNR